VPGCESRFRGRPKPDKAVLFAEGVKNGARRRHLQACSAGACMHCTRAQQSPAPACASRVPGPRPGARIKVVENEAGRQQHAAGLGDWEAKKDERGAAAPGGAADPGGARQPHCQAAHGGASAQHAPPAAQAAPGDADARRAGPAAHGKPGGRPAAARAAAAPPEHAAGGQPHAAARAPGAAAGQAAAGAEGAAGAHGGAPGAPGGDAGDAAQRAIASVRSAVDALEAQACARPPSAEALSGASVLFSPVQGAHELALHARWPFPNCLAVREAVRSAPSVSACGHPA